MKRSIALAVSTILLSIAAWTLLGRGGLLAGPPSKAATPAPVAIAPPTTTPDLPMSRLPQSSDKKVVEVAQIPASAKSEPALIATESTKEEPPAKGSDSTDERSDAGEIEPASTLDNEVPTNAKPISKQPKPATAGMPSKPVVTSSTGEGAEKYSLAYKFNDGQTVRWKVVHRATITSTIRGSTQNAQTKSESVKRWDMKKAKPDGSAVFVHSVESVIMTNRLPNRAEIVWDSRDKTTPPVEFLDASEAVGVPLTEVTITKHGNVLDRLEHHMQPGSKSDTPIAFPMPAEPVAVGAIWNEPHDLIVDMPENRTRKIQTRRRFELKEVKDGVAKIHCEFQILDPAAQRDPVVQSQIVQQLYTGTLWFDMNLGQVKHVEMNIDKHVVGFSGPDSSMHYLAQFTEELAPTGVAAKPAVKPATK